MPTCVPTEQEVTTHEGRRGPEKVCHLLDEEGMALCGAGAVWGIPENAPERDESPCTCGKQRCPECLDR